MLFNTEFKDLSVEIANIFSGAREVYTKTEQKDALAFCKQQAKLAIKKFGITDPQHHILIKQQILSLEAAFLNKPLSSRDKEKKEVENEEMEAFEKSVYDYFFDPLLPSQNMNLEPLQRAVRNFNRVYKEEHLSPLRSHPNLIICREMLLTDPSINDMEKREGEGGRILDVMLADNIFSYRGKLMNERGERVKISDYFIFVDCQAAENVGNGWYHPKRVLGKPSQRFWIAADFGITSAYTMSYFPCFSRQISTYESILEAKLVELLPNVENISDVPFLTSQGLALKSGVYKTSTGYRLLKNHAFEDVVSCEKKDVKGKVDKLLSYFEMEDVIWTDGCSRGNLLSAIMTSFYSLSFDIRNGLVVTSRQSGNGKYRLSKLLLSLHPGRSCEFDFSVGGTNESYLYAAALDGGVSATFWQDVTQQTFKQTARVKNLLTGCTLRLKKTAASTEELFEGRQLLIVDGRALTLNEDFLRRFTPLSFIRKVENVKLDKKLKFSESELLEIRRLIFELTLLYTEERGVASVSEAIGWHHYCFDFVEWCGLGALGSNKDISIEQQDIDSYAYDFLCSLKKAGKKRSTEILDLSQLDVDFGTAARKMCGITADVNLDKEGCFNSFKQGLVGAGTGRANVIARMMPLKDVDTQGLILRREEGKRGSWYVETVGQTDFFDDTPPKEDKKPKRTFDPQDISNLPVRVESFKKEDVLAQVSVLDILKRYSPGTLDGAKSGTLYCCPFHKDKTPSFDVSNNLYNCFGCGKGGDAISLATEFIGSGVSFGAVVNLLGGAFGVNRRAGTGDIPANGERLERDRDEGLEERKKNLARFCEGVDWTNKNTWQEKKYLNHRGINPVVDHVFYYHKDQHCLVAIVENLRSKEITGVHRLYLNADSDDLVRDESGKRRKLALGVMKGSCVFVRKLESLKTLYIAEGIETAYAFCGFIDQEKFKSGNVVAAVSASGMANIEIPDGVEEVICLLDNDQASIDAFFKLRGRVPKGVDIVSLVSKNKDFLDDWNSGYELDD